MAITLGLADAVLVKFWTNNGTIGCHNPSKSCTPLPGICVLPFYILLKDDVNVYAYFPMSGKFWPLHCD
jgi:hypothetical protein